MTPAVDTSQGTVRAFRRISVAKEESSSIARQLDSITRWRDYARPGAALEVYTDEGISGRKRDLLRERERLLRDLRPGDVLVATKVDRLARSVRDLLDIVKHCEDTGAAVIFIEQGIDTSGAYGKFMIVMLGALAELEANVVGERVTAARRAFARTDRYGVGKLPWGWHAVKDAQKGYLVARPIRSTGPCVRCVDKEGNPIVHDREGERLRDAVLAVIDGQTIASQAERLGLPYAEALGTLCRNTRLYGQPAEKGAVADPETAIITKAEWLKLQERLIHGRTTTKTNGYGPALFCAICEGRLYFNTANGKYACHASHRPRPGTARRIVDSFVEQEFLSRYGAGKMVEAKFGDDTERQERLAEIAMDLNEVTDMMRSPGADIPALAQRITALHQERESVEAQPAEHGMVIQPTGQSVRDYWQGADYATRVEMINQCMRVRVHLRGRQGGRYEIIELKPANAMVSIVMTSAERLH